MRNNHSYISLLFAPIFLLLCFSCEAASDTVYDAISRGDLQRVADLFDRGFDINQSQEDWPPLIFAASYGQKRILEYLISKGANINARNVNGDTALILAAHEGHVEIVSLLLKNNAGIDLAGNDGSTALIWAIRNGHESVITTLLSHQADPNIVILPKWYASSNQTNNGTYGATALMYAAQGNDKEILEMLIKAGADVNQTDSNCNSALHYAIYENQIPMINILREHGASDNPSCLVSQVKQLLIAVYLVSMTFIIGRTIAAKKLPDHQVKRNLGGCLLNYSWIAVIYIVFIPEGVIYPTFDTLIYYALLLVPILTIAAFLLPNILILSRLTMGLNLIIALLLVFQTIRLCSGVYHPVAVAIVDAMFLSLILIIPLMNVILLLSQLKRRHEERV